jgi:hypothetical protein
MASCNISRSTGLKVYIPGSTTVESALFNKISNLIEKEPDFVQARSYWLKDLVKDGKIVPVNPEDPFEMQKFDPKEVALKIYLYMTKQVDMETFMKGSPHVNAQGEPMLFSNVGKIYTKSASGSTKTVIPERKPYKVGMWSSEGYRTLLMSQQELEVSKEKTTFRSLLKSLPRDRFTKVLERFAEVMDVKVEIYPTKSHFKQAYPAMGTPNAIYDPNANIISMINREDPNFSRYLLHEVLHAVSYWTLNDKDSQYSKDMNRLYEATKNSASQEDIDYHYGLSNVDEFVSEAFSNPKFQRFLDSRNLSVEEAKTVWTRFVDLVLDIVKSVLPEDVKKSGTVLSYAVKRTIEQAMLNPDFLAIQETTVPRNSLQKVDYLAYEDWTEKPSKLTREIVNELSRRFGITVEYDSNMEEKGQFINDDNGSKVKLNLSKMTADTPFHEFAHALILAIKKADKALYDKMVSEYGSEEQLVEAIGKRAVSKSFMNTLNRIFREVLKALFPGVALPSINRLDVHSTIKDIVDVLLFSDSVDISGIEQGVWNQEQIDDLKDILQSRKVNDVDYGAALTALHDSVRQDDNDEEHYYVGDRPLGRLTQWIASTFSKAHWTAEELARNLFKNNGKNWENPGEIVVISNGTIRLTYDDALNYFTIRKQLVTEEGRLKHKFLEYMMASDAKKVEMEPEIRLRINKWQVTAAHPQMGLILQVEDIEHIGHWSKFKYIANNFNFIMKTAGIRKWVKTHAKESRDFTLSEEDKAVYHEKMFYSNILNIGTTADMVVVHKDNSVSMYDWKTGDILSDIEYNRILKYADEWALKDSKLNKAKFELVLRAVILKENIPETIFRNLKVIQLNSNGVQTYQADVEDYLMLLSKYLKAEKPAEYAEMDAKKLFDITSYVGTSDSIERKLEEMNGVATTLAEKIEYATKKIRSYGYKESLANLKNPKDIGAASVIKDWAYVLLDLVKDEGAQLDLDKADISSFSSNFKNLADVENPVVQAYNKILIKAQNEYQVDVTRLEDKHDRLFKAMLEDRLKVSKGVRAPIAVINALRTASFIGTAFNPLITAGVYAVGKVLNGFDISNEDIYGWLYEATPEGGEILNLSNTYFNKGTERREEMTDSMRAYRDFLVESFDHTWSDTMSSKIDVNMGMYSKDTVTKANYYGMGDTLPKGFFPRTPLTEDDTDIRLAEGGLSNFALGVLESARRSVRNNLSDYTDTDYAEYAEDSALVPVRFVSHPGDGKISDKRVNGHRAYTHDMGASFKMFIRNQYKKKHFDDAFIIGMATTNVLRFKKVNKANPELSNLANFLEKQVLMQTLDEYDKDKLFHKPITYKLGKWGAKVWGLDEGTTITLSAYKMMRLLMGKLSFLVMTFKPLMFVFNTALIQLINFSKAVSGSIAYRIGNVPPEYANATVSGYLATLKDYSKYV